MASSLSDTLLKLGRWLQAAGYQFTTVTPATHARVNARHGAAQARNLRDVFGWSRPFGPGLLPADALGWLQEGGLLDNGGRLGRSKVRFSTLGGQLYAHSAYPTLEADAVFFGPDTCRFAALIEAGLARKPLGAGARILDVGCGAGPGGMTAALASPAGQPELLLADISGRALDFARANAALAGLANTHFRQSDLFAGLGGGFDLIVANPPYLLDGQARLYRHGGGALGCGLSVRIVQEGWHRLAPGGRLMLYTGAPIVDGLDTFYREMAPLLQQSGAAWCYRELDPDVFGEELEQPAYARAERIAAVALVAEKTQGKTA